MTHASSYIFICDRTERHAAICTTELPSLLIERTPCKDVFSSLANCLNNFTCEITRGKRPPYVSAMANPLKTEVIRLYKNLLYLGRDYPQGSAYFRQRLKSAFMKNKDVTDPEKIKQLVARGDFVIKELEALYFLRKYRAMKKRYYEPEK